MESWRRRGADSSRYSTRIAWSSSRGGGSSAAGRVELAGPTMFSPLMTNFMEYVKGTNAPATYHVLLMPGIRILVRTASVV